MSTDNNLNYRIEDFDEFSFLKSSSRYKWVYEDLLAAIQHDIKSLRDLVLVYYRDPRINIDISSEVEDFIEIVYKALRNKNDESRYTSGLEEFQGRLIEHSIYDRLTEIRDTIDNKLLNYIKKLS